MQARTWISRSLVAVMMTLGALALLASPAAADDEAPFDLPGCSANTLAAGDDAFASADMGFAINTGDGGVESIVHISENGIVSFDDPIEYWYNGFDLRDVASRFGDEELIAPLFADAVRDDGGSVTWGADTYAGRQAFCVQWNGMTPYVPPGYYNPASIADPLPQNSFELVIINRDDRLAGDFDVVVNYESIQWDDVHCPQGFDQFQPNGGLDVARAAPLEGFNNCGCDFEFEDGCFGDIILGGPLADVTQPVFPFDSVGALAGVAFPQGFSGQVIEFAGSGIVLQMTDDAGLAAGSLNSLQRGRWIIEVDDGFSDADLGRLAGDVTGNGAPLAGAYVQACTDEASPVCVSTVTDGSGLYEIAGAPLGDYIVSARGPAGTDFGERSQNVAVTSVFSTAFVPTIALTGPTPPADNVGFGPVSEWGSGTTVYWGEDLDLSYTGCVGGTVTWTLTANEGPSPLGGSLVEGPDGTYTGVVPALNPTHGIGVISITADCPDPADDETTSFDLYIDPSGTVIETHSGEPIAGALTVLSRSDLEVGPFVAVPDGDAIMSPSNRTNPFVVGDDGRFGWDVIAGFYTVTATADGCHAVGDPATPETVTDVLEVEPEWLGLILELDCNNPPTIADTPAIMLEAPVSVADLGVPLVADLDPDDVPALVVTSDVTGSLPLGATDVTWTVVDPDGASASSTQTVTVVDTTPPAVTISGDTTYEADSAAGAAVTFSAIAEDSFEGTLVATCSATSGDTLALGTTTISCTASDSSGNVGSATLDVLVQDTSGPADFSLVVDGVATSTDGDPVVVTYTASANDAVDGLLDVTCTPASGSLFPIGDTDVTCTATDAAGNVASGALTVTVTDGSDSVPPVLTLPGPVTVDAADAAGAIVTFAATAEDDGAAVAVTCDPASGSVFPVGDTAVTCTATDAAGNVASGTFTVTVDALPPVGDDIRTTIDDLADQLSDVDGLNLWDRWRVQIARWYLHRTDNDRYWDDGDRLDDRYGRWSSYNLTAAVSVLEYVHDPAVQALNLQLVEQIRALAQVRLDDAIAADGNSYRIAAAERALDVGDDRLDSGHLSRAARTYRVAWYHASRAS